MKYFKGRGCGYFLSIQKVKIEPMYGIQRKQVPYQYKIQFKKEVVLSAYGSVRCGSGGPAINEQYTHCRLEGFVEKNPDMR